MSFVDGRPHGSRRPTFGPHASRGKASSDGHVNRLVFETARFVIGSCVQRMRRYPAKVGTCEALLGEAYTVSRPFICKTKQWGRRDAAFASRSDLFPPQGCVSRPRVPSPVSAGEQTRHYLILERMFHTQPSRIAPWLPLRCRPVQLRKQSRNAHDMRAPVASPRPLARECHDNACAVGAR